MRWYVGTYALLAQANYIVCLNWFSHFDCSMGMSLLQLFELTFTVKYYFIVKLCSTNWLSLTPILRG